MRLTGRHPVAVGTVAFELDPGGVFPFEAGQNIDVHIAGMSRTFSLVHAPGATPLAVATRMTGSAFKDTFNAMPLRTMVGVSGPNGTFTLPRESKRFVVFLAGGIGVTPFHSMVEDATLRKLPHRILLLYFNTAPSSTAFLSDLEVMSAKNPNLRVVPSMDNAGTEPWSGETRRAGEEVIREYALDPPNSVFYVAGPPGFAHAARKALIGMGIEDVFIKSEEFTGY